MGDQGEGIPLYLFTYNCGKCLIRADQFVTNFVRSLPDKLSELYVFGLQELCSIMDGSFYELANKILIQYNELFLAALKEKYGLEGTIFQTLGFHHIGAIGIIAITPYPLKFTKVRVAGSGCGYGFSSMKGGVGLRVTYKNQSQSIELTFANAHLSAYEGEYYYAKRNDNMLTLMRSLDFGDGYGLLKTSNHTFFMGDLNYRTSKKYEKTSASTMELLQLQDQSQVSSIEIENLVKKYDELYQGREQGDIFTGFTEGCVNFSPTYKFQVNTAIYNMKRSPSWCDRILFQSTYDELKNVPTIHKYNSIKSILQSDHQPVFLSITIPFRPPNPIVSSSGFLQVLQSEQPNRHSHSSDQVANFDETISGPTEIFMKPTRWDYYIQTYIRDLSDKCIGYGLFFGTTSKGRLYVLCAILSLWLYRFFIR